MKDKIAELMAKYGIEAIGGCHKCQPNADYAENWGIIPDELYDELYEDEKNSCCTEVNEYGREVLNFPVFCKYEIE